MNSGRIVKDILTEHGIKQSWVAKQLKMTNSTLCTKLSKDLPSATLFKICELIHISPEYVYQKLQKKEDTEHPAKNDSVSKNNKDT